ncbi:MAG: hypothetical protein EXR72_04495 [Myxococcales bacterium]|nr:hypothetical protein [Myxococcales bacterium]
MRIGELMVQTGVLSQEQLRTALRRQQATGDRIGALLVDLGYINEALLAQMLASQLQLPTATAAALEKVAVNVLALLTPELAARFHVCPVRLDGKRLWLAMSDPTDRDVIDVLQQATGCEIRAMVAPDTLITYALDRHYRVPRAPELVPVTDEVPVAMTIELSNAPPARPDPAPPAGRALGRIVPQPTPRASPVPVAAVAVATQKPIAGRITPTELGTRLEGCRSRVDLFDVALGLLGQDFGRVVVLALRRGQLVCARAQGAVADEQALRGFSARPRDIPVIAQAIEDGVPRMGRAASGTLGPLGPAVGPPGDRAILILPVRCSGESLGCFLALDGRDGVEAWFEDYARVAEKLDFALQMEALRRLLLGS